MGRSVVHFSKGVITACGRFAEGLNVVSEELGPVITCKMCRKVRHLSPLNELPTVLTQKGRVLHFEHVPVGHTFPNVEVLYLAMTPNGLNVFWLEDQ